MPDDSLLTLPPFSQAPYPDPIPGLIPFGSLVVVAGASGAGKTIMLAEWMQRLRDGRSICGHPTNPCTNYYVLAADRDWSTYAKAYGAAGFPDIEHYVLSEDPGFDPRSWGKRHSALTLFESSMELLAPIPGSWVNVDPVAPLFISGNQNDARDVALSLHWFRKIARKYQIILALFANVGKQKSDDVYKRAQDRIAGSGAFVAYSDTQISIEQDEDGVMSLQITPRNAPIEGHQFRFDTTTRLFVPYMDGVVLQTHPDLPAHLLKTFNLIPPEGTITSPELVKLVGEKYKIKRTQAFEHIRRLVELGVIERSDLGVLRRVSLPGASVRTPPGPDVPRE